MSAVARRKRAARKAAVALQFEKGKMAAPHITAKGRGLVAEKLIAAAREHGVPVVEDAFLIDALEPFDVGQEVPPELYQVVAEILVTLYKAENDSAARERGKTFPT